MYDIISGTYIFRDQLQPLDKNCPLSHHSLRSLVNNYYSLIKFIFKLALIISYWIGKIAWKRTENEHN